MPQIKSDINFRAYDEFQYWEYAKIVQTLKSETGLKFKPISGTYESSEVIDLLSGFTDLQHLVVVASQETSRNDLIEVTFDITDAQGTPQSTQFSSPYLVLLGMNSADYGTLQVTTTNATSSNPITLKILRLGE